MTEVQLVQGRTRPVTFTVYERRTSQAVNLTGLTVTLTMVRMRDNAYGEDHYDMSRGTGPAEIAVEDATTTVDPDQTARESGGNRGDLDWDPMSDGLGNDGDGGTLEVIGAGFYLAQLKIVDGLSDVEYAPPELHDLIVRVTPRLGEYTA